MNGKLLNGRLLALAAAGALIATTAQAQYTSPNSNAPGQQMQQRGSKSGDPGASGYAPGQQMQEKGNRAGDPGASGYAPGRRDRGTTGRGGGSMGDRDPDRDRGDSR